MKSENKNKNYFTGVIVYLLAISFIFVGCGNNNNGGGEQGAAPAAAVNPAAIAAGAISCANCPQNPVSLLTNVQASNASRNLQLLFDAVVGDMRGIPGNPTIVTPDDAPITRYSGTLAFRGMATIGAMDPALCNLPPGQYVMTTQQAGMASAGSFSQAVVLLTGANGQGQAILTMSGLFFMNSGVSLSPTNQSVRINSAGASRFQVNNCQVGVTLF